MTVFAESFLVITSFYHKVSSLSDNVKYVLRSGWIYISFIISFLEGKIVLVIIYYNYIIIQRRQWHPTPVLLPGKSHGQKSLVGCSPWGRLESDTTERLHFHALEKEMATHSSVLAWRIPGMGEPGGLPSMGLHRVRHDWIDTAAAYNY